MSQCNANLLSCMLITANVGTIFENPALLESWFQQLKFYLAELRPQLVAIHCQEVGGKNYGNSMEHVSNFTDKIMGDESIIGAYSRVRIFLDENFEDLEKFTALGSLYLIHDSVQNIKLYNFKTAQYESIEGREVYAGNSADKPAEHVEKVKFPQGLFPECRWSRKGYMRTRWLFNDNKPLDLVNIHLFHDASNLVAMETTPSPYAQNRQRALEFTLHKIKLPLIGTLEQSQQTTDADTHADVPMFIFGDFNFRLDTSKVIQRITKGVAPIVRRCEDSDEVLEMVYHRRLSTQATDPSPSERVTLGVKGEDNGKVNYSDQGDVVMTVGKKLFDCHRMDETFRAAENTKWLQELDNELDSFRNKLFEFKISFNPSYPFKEDNAGAFSYMKTRCPAWCDRILFNAAAGRMIYTKLSGNPQDDSEERVKLFQNNVDVSYRLMGDSAPMGDHKPVLLYCKLNLSTEDQRCRPELEAELDSSNLIESTAM